MKRLESTFAALALSLGVLFFAGCAAPKSEKAAPADISAEGSAMTWEDNQAELMSAAPATRAKTGTYTVAKGDTLCQISVKVYGSPRGWSKIYDANRNVIPDPDKLAQGTRLVIPD